VNSPSASGYLRSSKYSSVKIDTHSPLYNGGSQGAAPHNKKIEFASQNEGALK